MNTVDRRLDSRLRARRFAAVGVLALVIGSAFGCGSILGLERPLYDDDVEHAKPGQSADGGRLAEDGAPLPSIDPGPDAGTPSSVDGDQPGEPSPVCAGVADCERVVFVTSKLYPGSLAAIGGADQVCTNVAAQASHARIRGRSFRAWLSVGTASAAMRLVHGTKPYRLPNGVMVALTFDDFLGAGIRAPISLDEQAVSVSSFAVWTGTKLGGNPGGADCAGWTSQTSAATGVIGTTKLIGNEWTNLEQRSCNDLARLYCFEE